VNEREQNIEKQIKLYTALMMFYSGQASSGAVCEIAAIDRYSFIEKCKQYNIPVINLNVDEIKNEIQQDIHLTK